MFKLRLLDDGNEVLNETFETKEEIITFLEGVLKCYLGTSHKIEITFN